MVQLELRYRNEKSTMIKGQEKDLEQEKQTYERDLEKLRQNQKTELDKRVHTYTYIYIYSHYYPLTGNL